MPDRRKHCPDWPSSRGHGGKGDWDEEPGLCPWSLGAECFLQFLVLLLVLQLDFRGASAVHFFLSVTPLLHHCGQFGEEISLRDGNLPSPCVRVFWVCSYSSAKDFFRLYAEYFALTAGQGLTQEQC